MTMRIGLAGLGTVGGEVGRLLQVDAAQLAARAGRPLALTAIAARDKGKARPFSTAGLAWVDDPAQLAARPDVDVVVELIGGAEGPARALAEAALRAGKPLVTANKALLAHHGLELAQLAETHKAPLYYEAAVAGGIPVIKTLREALAGNRISAVSGILNGTCNYILSTMQETGRAFADVLAEAQKLGYAEADPSFDIDGLDAGHKLVILAALSFGAPVQLDRLTASGIRAITPLDIRFAHELGYRIKLLGVARRNEKGISQRVGPVMVPEEEALAHVNGAMNAVSIEGAPVGPLMLSGRGAGAGPTASAVLADLVDCAAGRKAPVFGMPVGSLKEIPVLPPGDDISPYYVRVMVLDKPGVLADMAAIMRDSAISIQSLLQKGRAAEEAVPVVFITHETSAKAMEKAVAMLEKLPSVLEKPVVISMMPDKK